jgi:uncharacterized membrane protein
MRVSVLLRIAFFMAIVILLSNAVFISRDYQDSWILEGLEIPFVMFMVIYAITFFSEKSAKSMVVLAVVCISVFVLIPNLKYKWFLGRYIDQQRQYSLTNYTVEEGHILPENYWVSGDSFYATTPLLHLFFASFSILTNIPLLYVFKFLPVLLSSIYPLLTYITVRNLGLTKERTVLRYALFISSMPIESALSYLVSGSMFGVLLSFFILSQIVKLLRKNSSSTWLLLVIFSVVLVMSHSFSALQLTLLLLAILVLQKFSSLRIKSYVKASTVFLMLLLNLGWLTFSAMRTLRNMTYEILNMGVLWGIYPERGVVPVRTFELAYVNIFETLKTILVINGAYAFLLLVMIGSIILIAKNRKWSNALKFLCLFNLLLVLLLAFAVLSRFGAYYWQRMPMLASIFYGIFFGILAVHLGKKRTRPLIAILLLITVVLATIQFYHCQPLVSPANVLLRNLPADEPLIYVVDVNSIYQREMIRFAEVYVNDTIVSDEVTTNQIVGLTRYDFPQTHLVWFYPFSRLIDKSTPQKEYDFFLMHLPGKSGAFAEQAEIRTKNLIFGALNNSTNSVVYSNGESFIVAKSIDGGT